MRPLLLDTFCKAGGTSMGYHRAGFKVVGIDIEPQPRYPFELHQGDAIEFILRHGKEFDVIAASPPCQVYSVTAALSNGNHPDLVAKTRMALQQANKPYIIENVPGAPLVNPITLCGTMFPGLRVIRHRLFECDPVLWWPPAPCQHIGYCAGSSLKVNGKRKTQSFKHVDYITVVGRDFIVEDAKVAMGIDWMTRDELNQAIPPAYTEWIGREIRRLLNI